MEFVMTVVRTIRSLRADYNLTKTRADCKSAAPDTLLYTQLCSKVHIHRQNFFIYTKRIVISEPLTFLAQTLHDEVISTLMMEN